MAASIGPRARRSVSLHQTIVFCVVNQIDEDDMPFSDGVEETMEMREIHTIEVGHAKTHPISLGDGRWRDDFAPLTVYLNSSDRGPHSLLDRARHLFSPSREPG